MIKQYVLDLQNEFKGYNGKKFCQDLLAGAAVTAVALPLALAFGVSSGAEAAAGLVTAIVAGLLIGALSGASFQVSGPTGAMVAILSAVAYEHGMQGIFLAGFLAGIMLILAGIFKFGKLVEFIPAPVITGFTSGIAVIIAFGEFDGFLGVTVAGENVLAQVFHIIQGVFNGSLAINPSAVLMGAVVIAIMLLWPKKWDSKVPSSLVGIIVALLLYLFGHFSVAVVGDIPKTLLLENRLAFDSLRWGTVQAMMIPALSIAALAMIESLLCGVAGGRMKGEKLNADRELVAQGVGNVVLPFLGGIPATAAIARTSMAIKSGGQTRIAVMLHGVGLLLSMFLLSGFMSQIPMAALSGVLIVVGFRMNDWSSIKYIFGKRIHSAMLSFTVTLLATVILDLAMAIVIGLVLSSFFFILRVAKIDINVADIDYEKLANQGFSAQDNGAQGKVVYLSGPIFFAAIDHINQKLASLAPQDFLVFSMRGVPMVDTSGGQALLELCEKYKKQGTVVMFSGVQPKVMEMFRIDGIAALVEEGHFFWDTEQAITAYLRREKETIV